MEDSHSHYKQMNLTDKFFLRLVWAVTAVVLLVVILLKIVPAPSTVPSSLYLFPHIIGGINATCAVLLVISLIFIKNKNIQAHKITNVITFILSSIFLIFYIVFHLYVKDTKFGDADHNGILSSAESAGVGAIRYVYYVILITHIMLAVIVLPLILVSFFRGFNMQIEKHKKIVRWAYPVWLYVAVSGVIVYLMISPYYNF
ncbi:MAG: YozB [Pedobacter sp.]|nr:YozB [Pedobacter sp.]